MKKGRIVEGLVVELCAGNPAELFHPEIAALFSPVPDDVTVGSLRLGDGSWQIAGPAPQPEAAQSAPKVSPVEFKLLFTPQERVAMRAARATDPVIADFFDVIDDPRLTYVDLGLQSTQDAIAYLVGSSYLTGERGAEVLAGSIK